MKYFTHRKDVVSRLMLSHESIEEFEQSMDEQFAHYVAQRTISQIGRVTTPIWASA